MAVDFLVCSARVVWPAILPSSSPGLAFLGLLGCLDRSSFLSPVLCSQRLFRLSFVRSKLPFPAFPQATKLVRLPSPAPPHPSSTSHCLLVIGYWCVHLQSRQRKSRVVHSACVYATGRFATFSACLPACPWERHLCQSAVCACVCGRAVGCRGERPQTRTRFLVVTFSPLRACVSSPPRPPTSIGRANKTPPPPS